MANDFIAVEANTLLTQSTDFRFIKVNNQLAVIDPQPEEKEIDLIPIPICQVKVK